MRLTGVLFGITVLLVSGIASNVLKPPEEFAMSIKTTVPWHVVYQKFTGPFSGIPKAMEEVGLLIKKYDFVTLGPLLSEYYNSPLEVDSTKLEWAIMLPVLKPLTGFPKETEGKVSVKALEPIQVAYTYHQGPYREVGNTYQKLFAWIFQNGYQIAGPVREIYWSDPKHTPEDKLIAEVQIPVKK